MRILVDWDDTVQVKGKVDREKIKLLRKAKEDGHSVKIYTSRRGAQVDAVRRKLVRHKLNIEVIGDRERFDLFIDSNAGDWDKFHKHVTR